MNLLHPAFSNDLLQALPDKKNAGFPEIILTGEERVEWPRRVRLRLTSGRLEQRTGIVLLAVEGFQNKHTAQKLSVGRGQVSCWRPEAATHWGTRTMAAEVCVCSASVAHHNTDSKAFIWIKIAGGML